MSTDVLNRIAQGEMFLSELQETPDSDIEQLNKMYKRFRDTGDIKQGELLKRKLELMLDIAKSEDDIS